MSNTLDQLLEFYSLYHLGGAKTVREWGELAEDDPSQRTSQITVRVCHDFEYAISKVLKESYGYEIVPKSGTNNIEGNFDVAIQKGETVLAFEVKTTQSTNGWTGSTRRGAEREVTSVLLETQLTSIDRKVLLGVLTNHLNSNGFIKILLEQRNHFRGWTHRQRLPSN